MSERKEKEVNKNNITLIKYTNSKLQRIKKRSK